MSSDIIQPFVREAEWSSPAVMAGFHLKHRAFRGHMCERRLWCWNSASFGRSRSCLL